MLLIFDLDDTLYKFGEYSKVKHAGILEFISKKLNLSKDDAEKKFSEARKSTRNSLEAFRLMGLDKKSWVECLNIFDPAVFLKEDKQLAHLLSALSKSHKLVVHTNSPEWYANRALEVLNIRKFFGGVFTSEHFEPKPNASAVREILKMMNFSPEESVYIGDRIFHDLEPAKEAGLKTVLISKEHIKHPAVDFVVDDVKKLADILERNQRC